MHMLFHVHRFEETADGLPSKSSSLKLARSRNNDDSSDDDSSGDSDDDGPLQRPLSRTRQCGFYGDIFARFAACR